MNKAAVVSLVLLGVLAALVYMSRSKYELQPLQTDSTTDPSGLWTLKRGLECSAGMNANNDGHYSSNKVPSGICGTGAWAQKLHAVKITDGVGGSIFDRQAMLKTA